MPDGIGFVGSWVTADLGRCFQIMECDDITLLQRWAAEWSDLIEFEIVPVVQGKDTGSALAQTTCNALHYRLLHEAGTPVLGGARLRPPKIPAGSMVRLWSSWPAAQS